MCDKYLHSDIVVWVFEIRTLMKCSKGLCILNTFHFEYISSVFKYCKIFYVTFLKNPVGFSCCPLKGSISSRYLMNKSKLRICTPQKFLDVYLICVPYNSFCIFPSLLPLGGQRLLRWR